MNCFLIDFENVNSGGMKGIEYLTENDDVYIFYSDHANSITFDIHHKMNKSSANIHFFKSEIIGKNSLDFQIVSYMGYLVAQKKYQNYFLISIDRGFDFAVRFWQNYFKQNKITDLQINRYYNIQDGLNKKTVSFDTRRPTRKVPPTIPTMESELELQQLKAANIIPDRTSPTIEKHIEKNLIPPATVANKPKLNGVAPKPPVKPPKQKRKPVFLNKETTDVEAKPTIEVATPPITEVAPPKVLEPVEAPKPVLAPANDVQDTTKPVTPTNTTNNVGKKAFAPPQKKPIPKKPTTPAFESKPSKPAFSGGNKPAFTEQRNKPTNVTPPPVETKDKADTTPTVQSKGFVFGKIDLNDSAPVTENIKSKSAFNKPETTNNTTSNTNNNSTKPTTEPKEPTKEPKVKDTLLRNTKPKHETPNTNTPTPKATTPKDSKPTTERTIATEPAPKKEATKPTNDSKTTTSTKATTDTKDTKKDTPKAEKSEKTTKNFKAESTKRKVGRPRVRPVVDESKKPKNNKRFEQAIPDDQLATMLESIAQIDHLNGYSYEDKVKVCKVIVFSDTKQNCYRAFMSCFGKLKGVEIYGAVKSIYQSIKDLYVATPAQS